MKNLGLFILFILVLVLLYKFASSKVIVSIGVTITQLYKLQRHLRRRSLEPKIKKEFLTSVWCKSSLNY